jgi:hypothetical protein
MRLSVTLPPPVSLSFCAKVLLHPHSIIFIHPIYRVMPPCRTSATPSIHPSIHPSPYSSPKAPILMRPCILRYWSCLMHPVQSDKKPTRCGVFIPLRHSNYSDPSPVPPKSILVPPFISILDSSERAVKSVNNQIIVGIANSNHTWPVYYILFCMISKHGLSH